MGDGDVGVLQIAFRKLPDRSSSQRELEARKLPVLVNRCRPPLEVIPSFDRAIPLRHEVGDLAFLIEVHRRADALGTICERHSGRFVVYGPEGDLVVQESGGEPDHLREVAHHRSLVHLRTLIVHNGEERACLDKHAPLSARVHISPSRYWKWAFVDSGVPYEAGWLHRVVLLSIKGNPPSFRAQVHLSLLLEVNGIHDRFADDACVPEVAPHRLREVLEHPFGDDSLSCCRGSSGEECLDVPLYQAVEPPEPESQGTQSAGEDQRDCEDNPSQKSLHGWCVRHSDLLSCLLRLRSPSLADHRLAGPSAFYPPLDAVEHLAGGKELPTHQNDGLSDCSIDAWTLVGPRPHDQTCFPLPSLLQNERPTELPVDFVPRVLADGSRHQKAQVGI